MGLYDYTVYSIIKRNANSTAIAWVGYRLKKESHTASFGIG